MTQQMDSAVSNEPDRVRDLFRPPLVETTVTRVLLLEMTYDFLHMLGSGIAVGAAKRFGESMGRVVSEVRTDTT